MPEKNDGMINKTPATDVVAKRQAGAAAALRQFAANILVKDQNFRGRSVLCLAHEIKPDADGDVHQIVADAYGYPVWLTYLQDTIFDGLSNDDEGENFRWNVRLMEAIANLSADYNWSLALHRVHIAILRSTGSNLEIVQYVINLHERATRGEVVSDDMWIAAHEAAHKAVRTPMSETAMASARSTSRSADWAAVDAAAWAAARVVSYRDIRDAILTALSESEFTPTAILSRKDKS